VLGVAVDSLADVDNVNLHRDTGLQGADLSEGSAWAAAAVRTGLVNRDQDQTIVDESNGAVLGKSKQLDDYFSADESFGWPDFEHDR